MKQRNEWEQFNAFRKTKREADLKQMRHAAYNDIDELTSIQQPEEQFSGQRRIPQGIGSDIQKHGAGLYNGYGFSAHGQPGQNLKALNNMPGSDFYRTLYNEAAGMVNDYAFLNNTMSNIANSRVNDYAGSPLYKSDYKSNAIERLTRAAELASQMEYEYGDEKTSDFYMNLYDLLEKANNGQGDKEAIEQYLRNLGF